MYLKICVPHKELRRYPPEYLPIDIPPDYDLFRNSYLRKEYEITEEDITNGFIERVSKDELVLSYTKIYMYFVSPYIPENDINFIQNKLTSIDKIKDFIKLISNLKKSKVNMPITFSGAYIVNSILSADPKYMVNIKPDYIRDWKVHIPEAFELLPEIRKKLGTIYTPLNYLRVFRETEYNNVSVVVLGQDPYHNGNATGLAFDVDIIGGKKANPSLKNIFKEKGSITAFGDVLSKQGVLLLNTALTVELGRPGSHIDLWKEFTTKVIEHLGNKDLVWLLFGSHAHSYLQYIKKGDAICTSHPSPLSANKRCGEYPAFLGSGVFKECNRILTVKQKNPIQW